MEQPLNGNPPEPTTTKKKLPPLARLALVLFLVALAVIGTALALFTHYYYSRVQYEPVMHTTEITVTPAPTAEAAPLQEATPAPTATPLPTPSPTPSPTPDPEQVLEAALEEQAEEIVTDNSLTNILLLGLDARKTNEVCRSDTMILVTINPDNRRIVLTSFMRDGYVQIPGKGKTRMNAAYAYGGANLVMRTIRDDFGIPVDRYATVDFYSFIDVVDLLGGVTMDVNKTQRVQLNKVLTGINWLLKEKDLHTDSVDATTGGELHMDGRQALAYARVRHGDGQGDITRTARQRELVMALLQQHKDLKLSELYALLEAVLPNVTTDLTAGETLAMLLHTKEYLGYEFVSVRVPEKISYVSVNGASMVRVNYKAAQKTWMDAVYGE